MAPLLLFIISIFVIAIFAVLIRQKINEIIVSACALVSCFIGWHCLSLRTEEIFMWLFLAELFASAEKIM